MMHCDKKLCKQVCIQAELQAQLIGGALLCVMSWYLRAIVWSLQIQE